MNNRIDMSDLYKIVEITPKAGELRDIHKNLLKCPAIVLSSDINERARLLVRPKDDPDNWHEIWLSRVVGVQESTITGILTIETRNTFYQLWPYRE